jgi:hypothetical protein
MELRIREVDEGGGGPFDKLRDRGSFGTVSELVELADKFRGRGSFAKVMSLPNWPLLIALG